MAVHYVFNFFIQIPAHVVFTKEYLPYLMIFLKLFFFVFCKILVTTTATI